MREFSKSIQWIWELLTVLTYAHTQDHARLGSTDFEYLYADSTMSHIECVDCWMITSVARHTVMRCSELNMYEERKLQLCDNCSCYTIISGVVSLKTVSSCMYGITKNDTMYTILMYSQPNYIACLYESAFWLPTVY